MVIVRNLVKSEAKKQEILKYFFFKFSFFFQEGPISRGDKSYL